MRIVAGRYRGRRLRGAVGKRTRPTSERARVGLFDWIGPRVSGARVLDLFAGSGSLGIEAMSRGAESAVFVERSRPALDALRRNLADLGLLDSVRVLARDAERALRELSRRESRFDLVFVDPPYASDWLRRLVGSAALVGVLAPGGVIIVERSGREAGGLCQDSRWQLRDSRSYGETVFDWYERSMEAVE